RRPREDLDRTAVCRRELRGDEIRDPVAIEVTLAGEGPEEAARSWGRDGEEGPALGGNRYRAEQRPAEERYEDRDQSRTTSRGPHVSLREERASRNDRTSSYALGNPDPSTTSLSKHDHHLTAQSVAAHDLMGAFSLRLQHCPFSIRGPTLGLRSSGNC